MPRAVSRHLDLFCVDTSDRVVGLTYDDGPEPRATERILEVLASRGVTATFFVLSRQARRYPRTIQRLVAEGHELALHGPDHRHILDMPTSEVMAGIRGARAEVEDIGGRRIGLYRPPYGRYSAAQALAIRRLGLDVVLWSCHARDWNHDDEMVIASRAAADVFPGGILLLHDDRGDPETLGADDPMPSFDRARVATLLLDALEVAAYQPMTVSALLESRRQVRSFQPMRWR